MRHLDRYSWSWPSPSLPEPLSCLIYTGCSRGGGGSCWLRAPPIGAKSRARATSSDGTRHAVRNHGTRAVKPHFPTRTQSHSRYTAPGCSLLPAAKHAGKWITNLRWGGGTLICQSDETRRLEEGEWESLVILPLIC